MEMADRESEARRHTETFCKVDPIFPAEGSRSHCSKDHKSEHISERKKTSRNPSVCRIKYMEDIVRPQSASETEYMCVSTSESLPQVLRNTMHEPEKPSILVSA